MNEGSRPLNDCGPAPGSASGQWVESFLRHTPLLALMVLLALCGWLFYRIVEPMLMAIFLAAVTALLVEPLHAWVGQKMSPRLAAAVVTLALFVVFVGPASLTIAFAVDDFSEVLTWLRSGSARQDALGKLTELKSSPAWGVLLGWQEKYSLTIDKVAAAALDLVNTLGDAIYRATARLVGSIPMAILNGVVFAIFLWFFLADHNKIIKAWEDLTPLRIEDDRSLRSEFSSVCRGVVWGTLAAAVVQSLLLAAILLLIAAFSPSISVGSWILFLGLATVLAAAIPFVGATSVWAPTAAWLIFTGKPVEGTVLALLGVSVISTSDNIVKIWAIKDAARLHPLLVFVCVFGGLKAFGIFGVFLGPIIGAIMFALVRVVRKEAKLIMQTR